MAREMTPQERAAAFVQAWMKQSTYTTESFINDVLEHDKQTRREALLEAADIAFDHACDDPQWCTCNSVICRALTKLAQEG